jgi:hypothetical protein
MEESMYEASCHCGQVRIEIAELPATVTDCNCSICRRYGALWGYYRRDQVRLDADPATLSAYLWGDRTIEFWHCRNCGCLTHYESVEKNPDSRFVINARMLPLETLQTLRVRKLDGADTWEYFE